MKRIIPILLLAATTCSWAQQGSYSLKTPEAPTGTRIRPDAARGAIFPLNKRYEEFTSDERRALKSAYEPMLEEDEPPFPKNGLSQLILQIRDAVTKRQARGRLMLIASVDASGSVEKVDIYASPDDQLSRYAAILLGRTAFKPAKCSGQPCRMEFPLSMQFRLE